MKGIQKIGLLLIFLGIHQTALAEKFVGKEDLKGQWNFKTATCTGGKKLDEIKSAALSFDGQHLSLSLKDEKSKKDESVIDTNMFALQEDLLTFTKPSNGFATVKVQKKSNTLLVKFPVVGISGDCPENELMIWTFQRRK